MERNSQESKAIFWRSSLHTSMVRPRTDKILLVERSRWSVSHDSVVFVQVRRVSMEIFLLTRFAPSFDAGRLGCGDRKWIYSRSFSSSTLHLIGPGQHAREARLVVERRTHGPKGRDVSEQQILKIQLPPKKNLRTSTYLVLHPQTHEAPRTTYCSFFVLQM